ncbi:Spy/CpxP family protein refolding chaperone [Rhodanobacter sp. L36]|uniref:Spy/CpxP family protein refolding chaperone n=1 Tax=Rhodanobacter sp. L36 TaxID=1747221 RepID=UPI00131CEEFC|nr:Spy/CpxP family protein refolding chaperone [Rhodanobacter sp. L36]
MRKTLLLGLTLASAVALSTFAVAGPAGGEGGWHGGHGHHGGQFMALKKLDLTDAQRASIKQIVQASFAQNKTQRTALRQQRSAFESMTPDQVGYTATASRLAQAEGAATQVRVQQQATIRAQIYAVLTAPQKAQLATMKAQQDARRQQWQQLRAQQKAAAGTTPQAAQ